MIPNQIVTGSANPNPNTFASTHFNDETYFAYSSSRNVYILKSGSLRVVQVLTGHKNDVTSIAWLNYNSKLLTSSLNEIFIYDLNQTNLEWERIMIIPNPFEITTMCWLNLNSFVVGGDYLAIWKLDFNQINKQNSINKDSNNNYNNSKQSQKIFKKQASIIWRIECSQPIQQISCSPDGSLFATVGKCDRMLKIWYKQPKILKQQQQSNDKDGGVVKSTTVIVEPSKQKGYFKDQFNKLTSKEPKFKFQQQQQQQDESISLSSLSTNNQKKIIKKQRFEIESFGFIYLPHPRAISWISWRMRDSSHHNILLTNCKDGVVRLWQQSLQSHRLQFNVSNIIHAGTESVDWINCYSPLFLQKKYNNNNQNNNNQNNNNQNNNNQNDQSIESSDLLTNLKNPILLRQKQGQLTKSKAIVDWVLGIKQDGTLIMWKLRSDDSTSRQTSSISIWINSPQILSPQEVGPNRIIALYQPLSMSDNTPTSITICVNSFNGAISCRKFYIQNQNHTQISNTSPPSRCYGHKSAIRAINISPASHYLSSIDRQNNIILWQTTDGTKIQSPYFLVDIGSIGTSYSISWSTQNNFCFSSNQDGILVYHIDPHDNNKPLKLPIGLIAHSNLQDEEYYKEIHVVELQCQLYQSFIQPPFTFFIIGINNIGDKLSIWGVSIEFNYSSPPSTMTSTTNQQFNFSSELLSTKYFDQDNLITCICPTPKGISDRMVKDYSLFDQQNNNNNQNNNNDIDNQIIPSHPICITGNTNGIISIWSLNSMIDKGLEQISKVDSSSIKYKIIELCSHGAYKQAVESISPAYFGRFATTPFTGGQQHTNPEIHIWELESHTPTLNLEDTIKFYTPEEFSQQQQQTLVVPTLVQNINGVFQIDEMSLTKSGCNFSFAYFVDGTISLAIGYKNSIRVLRKPVDRSIGSYSKPWMETHRYNDLSSNCVSVEWGKDRELMVASGNQILVFSKWMRPTDNFISSYNGSNIDTIYHQHSLLSRSLPYYHPKLLAEYMMAGKFDKVESILLFISNYLIKRFNFLLIQDKDIDHVDYDDDDEEEKEKEKERKEYEQQQQQKLLLKPISLPTLEIEELLMNNEKVIINQINQEDEDEDEENNNNNDNDQELEFLSNNNNNEITQFTKNQSNKLNEILSNVKLVGLSNSEQIQLLALTDTYGQIGEMRGGLDDNGQRFLLNVKIYQFLKRSLNPLDRPISLSAVDLQWALHSECQEALISSCFASDPTWEDLRQLGAGLWIKNPITLRNVIEKLAKTTYMVNKEPSDSALYYIALGKKGSLIALHRASKDSKHVDFLQQDFTLQKWINLAAKSAYLLQSKHKYDLAASMFLLAGDLKQAINLILQVKGDFQLAYVVARLFEGDNNQTSRSILIDHVVPHAKKTNDRPLLSICNWLLKNYEDSLKVLLPSTIIDDSGKKLDQFDHHGGGGQSPSPSASGSSSPALAGAFGRISSFNSLSSMTSPSNILKPASSTQHQKSTIGTQLRCSEMGPSSLYFFRYLKNHILLKQVAQEKKKDHPFLRSSIYSYLYSGCSHLALENILDMELSHPKLQFEIDHDDDEIIQDKISKVKDDLGLDFGTGGANNSYFKSSGLDDLDFGTTTTTSKSTNYLDDLDFGTTTTATTTKSSGLDDLDFGTTTSKSTNYLDDLDFGTPTKSSGLDDLDFGTTTPKTNIKSSKNSLKNQLSIETISLFPIIDLELKSKLVLQILVNNIVTFKESNIWNENIDRFDDNIDFLSSRYRLDRTTIIERLIVFCSHRQYYKQIIHLYQLLGRNSNDYLDQTCHSILKSIYRVDDYHQTLLQSQHLLKTSLELYSCINDIKDPSLVILSIYMMIFLSSWGYSRFDIIKSLLNENNNLDELIKLISLNPISFKYIDNSLSLNDSDDDDGEILYGDQLKQKISNDNITIKCLEKIFELFCLTRFKKVYDNIVKDLCYHHVFDLTHQRLHFWLVAIQSKILSPPHNIYDTIYSKPRNQSSTALLDLAKSLNSFNTEDRIDLWSSFLKDNENIDLLANTILPDTDNNSTINDIGKKIKFEEVVELYKDGDLLQSFCVDVSSSDLQMVAVATTRGIREIDLKQASNDHRSSLSIDDFDQLDQSVATTGEFLSPTQSRKLRISAKSVSSLNFKGGKQNVFKTAISSLNPTKQVDHNIIVQCLESHPNSSFYLSGGIDGSVCLWQFGIPEALAAYQLPTRPRIVRCKFNQSGSKFGACDMAGNLMLWQFAAQEDTLRPFYSLQAHSKQTLDFTFINSGSILATAGISSNSKKDVCLWDVLLPPHKSLIASYTDQENGASSITYSPKHQVIVVGGKKGSISLYDIRTNKTLDNFKGHLLNTKTLALDPQEDFVVSGSSDGNIKSWSLPSMTCLDTFEDAHKKQTFVRPTGVFKSPVSTYGVVQVRLANNQIYSCGADGRLTKRKYTTVKK